MYKTQKRRNFAAKIICIYETRREMVGCLAFLNKIILNPYSVIFPMPLLNIDAGIRTLKRQVLFCLFTCFNQMETIADDDAGIFFDDQFDGIDSGITRRKIRCKSAYPRLVSMPIPQNTNVGFQQLHVFFCVCLLPVIFQPAITYSK